MGIPGLLQFLKEHMVSVNIKKYSGLSVAVDVSWWIHQGAYFADYSWDTEGVVQKIINYVTKRIRMLVELNIKPIIVFDGSSISAKKRILDERTKNRINSREKSMHLLMEGRADEANKKFGQGFTITPYLIQRILKVIKGNWWEYVVAPYEADPQLAYLYKSGKADVVFTEDSDLIAYGVNKLLYKMDNAGDGFELDMGSLYKEIKSDSDKIRSSQTLTENSFHNKINMEENSELICIDWDDIGIKEESSLWLNICEASTLCISKINPLFHRDKFLSTCILAGWDYIEPIKGIGFKTAYKLIEKIEL